jgi:hypothetical protein
MFNHRSLAPLLPVSSVPGKLNKPPPHPLCSKFQNEPQNPQLAENRSGRKKVPLPMNKHSRRRRSAGLPGVPDE